MKLYKNGSIFTFKLFLLVTALNINFVMFASSSARKIVAPAMQSGLRALTTQAGATVPNISVSVNSAENYQPMVSMPSQATLNFNDGVFNNIPKASLLPQQCQASSGSGNNPFNAAILAGLTAAMVGSQVAHAGDETQEGAQWSSASILTSFYETLFGKKEETTDVEELFLHNGLDPKVYPELVKFIKKYRCSFDLEMQILFTRSLQGLPDYNMTKNAGGGHGFKFSPRNHFSAMSGFFMKGSAIDRIVNAERMKKVIEINKLDCLKVADKCLAIRAGDLCVIGKEIKVGDQNEKISVREVQQLVQFAKLTGYLDWQFGGNVMRDSDGKLVFIDTEDRSYLSYYFSNSHIVMHILYSWLPLDRNAFAWLRDEEKKLNNEINEFKTTPLFGNPAYDAEIGIDFEAVKKEYVKLQQDLD